MNWDQFFIRMAGLVSEKSKDRSTQVGAVVVGAGHSVLSIGYNGFPRGIDDDVAERHERPAKYQWTEHAERNAIFNAARHGIRIEGATLYLNWEPVPCPDCARACIQAGIVEIVGPHRQFPGDHWMEPLALSNRMLEEAGIKIRIAF